MVHGNYAEVTTDDVYVVNEKTLQVFYVNGVEFEGKTYYTKESEGSPDLDSIEINGKDVNPIVYTGMIPVVWNEAKSKWMEVENPDPDTTDNINTYDEWYDYDNDMFANVKLQDGSMYVWIPTSNAEGFWVAKYEASNNGNGEVQIIQGETVWTDEDGDITAKCKNIASLPSSGLDNNKVQTNLINDTQKEIVKNMVTSVSANEQYSVMAGTSSTSITATSDLGKRPVITGSSSGFAKVIPTPSLWEDEIKETREGNIPIPNGYYYVGGTADTIIYISDNAQDENLGTNGTTQGKIYKWISASKSSGASYANSQIAASVINYAGYYVDKRYNDSNQRIENKETYLDIVIPDNIAVCRRTGIWNVTDLEYFRDDVNAGEEYNNDFEGITIYLMADIDLSSVCSPTLGSWDPIGNDINLFMGGTFDGQYHTISNLYINTSEHQFVGLFGRNYGTIRRVLLEECNVKVYSNSAGSTLFAGGIAGAHYGEEISECGINSGSVIAERTITDASHATYAGGIAGRCYNFFDYTPKISCCYNRATVSATACSITSGNFAYPAGIVGNCTSSEIEYCYNSGQVVAKGYNIAYSGIAALLAGSTSKVSYCYNVGTLSGTATSSSYKHCGEIVGNNGNSSNDKGTILNSYGTTNSSYRNWYYSSAWGHDTAGLYAISNFKSSTSTPGTVLVGTGYYEADTSSINNGYLILDWENDAIEGNVPIYSNGIENINIAGGMKLIGTLHNSSGADQGSGINDNYINLFASRNQFLLFNMYNKKYKFI